MLAGVVAGKQAIAIFTQQMTSKRETINKTEYTVTMYGEQTADVTPKKGLSYLHHNFLFKQEDKMLKQK